MECVDALEYGEIMEQRPKSLLTMLPALDATDVSRGLAFIRHPPCETDEDVQAAKFIAVLLMSRHFGELAVINAAAGIRNE